MGINLLIILNLNCSEIWFFLAMAPSIIIMIVTHITHGTMFLFFFYLFSNMLSSWSEKKEQINFFNFSGQILNICVFRWNPNFSYYLLIHAPSCIYIIYILCIEYWPMASIHAPHVLFSCFFALFVFLFIIFFAAHSNAFAIN